MTDVQTPPKATRQSALPQTDTPLGNGEQALLAFFAHTQRDWAQAQAQAEPAALCTYGALGGGHTVPSHPAPRTDCRALRRLRKRR